MVILRFLVLAFNTAIITYLVYRMLEIAKQPIDKSKKILVIIGGVILLLAPLAIFFGFFMPAFQYFLIYPVAIGLYLYMIKEIR